MGLKLKETNNETEKTQLLRKSILALGLYSNQKPFKVINNELYDKVDQMTNDEIVSAVVKLGGKHK